MTGSQAAQAWGQEPPSLEQPSWVWRCSDVLLCGASEVLSGWMETVGRTSSALQMFDGVQLGVLAAGTFKDWWSLTEFWLFVLKV